jgi:hypothetical protein
MKEYALKTDTRLTADEIKELGLEEAPQEIGQSLEAQQIRPGGNRDE